MYNFLTEAETDPAIDPNANLPETVENPVQLPESQDQQQSEAETFQPLIKSEKDIPHSKDRAEVLKIAAQIRNIEAKTKETLAKAEQPDMGAEGMDPNMMGGIDPNTGMPMGGMNGAIDPMTGMPMDPNAQQNEPLKGLGDASAPPDPMGMGMGGIDPMTGMPTMDSGKSFTAVGRAFKLKKIYSILDFISHILHTSSDPKIQTLYKSTDEAFELFRLVVNNLKIYKDKVDDLIVMYYALLKDICERMETIYKENKLETTLSENVMYKKTVELLKD